MRLLSIFLVSFFSIFIISCSSEQDSLIEDIDSNASLVAVTHDDGAENALGNEGLQCASQLKTCSASEERTSVFDSSGCEQIICNPKPLGEVAKLPEPPFIWNPPPADPNEKVCRVHIRDNHYIDLKPSDGYINRYVAGITSYYPTKGRYAPGVVMFCERQYIRCHGGGTGDGTVGGRILQARYIADKDREKCAEATFVGHPEYTYNQYKDWYHKILERYQACKKREPTDFEVKEAIDSLLEEGKSLFAVYTNICSG